MCQSTNFLSFVRCRFINFVLTFQFTTTAKARTSDTATKTLQTNKHNLMIKQAHRQSGISCGQTFGQHNIEFPACVSIFSKYFIAFISTQLYHHFFETLYRLIVSRCDALSRDLVAGNGRLSVPCVAFPQ